MDLIVKESFKDLKLYQKIVLLIALVSCVFIGIILLIIFLRIPKSDICSALAIIRDIIKGIRS